MFAVNKLYVDWGNNMTKERSMFIEPKGDEFIVTITENSIELSVVVPRYDLVIHGPNAIIIASNHLELVDRVVTRFRTKHKI